MRFLRTGTVLLLLGVMLTACAGYFGPDGRRGYSSSLVDYLYPEGEIPPRHEGNLPHLKLPLNVGLAFVPGNHSYGFALSEAKKSELLESVKAKFNDLEYVQDITVIPETYLRSGKGFEGVDQIARLYGLDVMALVSYDQVAVAHEKKSSLLYWTIVGAYIIKGNENKASTFVDTAVFDVASRKMLLRAPGVSETKKSSTLIEVAKVNSQAREEGFEMAMDDMSQNLSLELTRFEEKIKQDRSVVVSHRDGYGGGGALGWLSVLLLASVALLRRL